MGSKLVKLLKLVSSFHNKCFLLFVLLNYLFISSLLAETANFKTIKLSMTQAIKIALKQSPEIQKSLLHIAMTQAEKNIAYAALQPKFDAMAIQRRDQLNIDTF